MNFFQVFGRLGRDPETRYTAKGKKVTTLRVAHNVRVAGQEETMWVQVDVWDDRFDRMITFLKKGSAVIVMGKLRKPRIYTDREGNPQVSLEMDAISLNFSPFGGRSDSEDQSATQQQAQQPQGQYGQAQQPYNSERAVQSFGSGSEHGDVPEEESMPF